MKHSFFFFAFVLLFTCARAQDTDSMLAAPQLIELSISTPQPRLKETFQVSIDIHHLRANIFRSLAGKVRLANDIDNSNNSELTLNVTALKKGKNEIGPLEFYLNKTKYTTNKITYEVIDPLPKTDNGLWFRKVATSDSTFCIIIEQRIPASSKTTQKSANSISITTEPQYNEIAKFKDSYSVDGLSGRNSYSNTNFSSVQINGEDKQFMYAFSVYHFKIEDRKMKIKITKDKFQNLPAGYGFEDIIIQ